MCCCCCSAGRGRSARLLAEQFRHRARLSLDRRGARLRRHGLSADGAGDPALGRRRSTGKLEQAAATLGANRAFVFLTVTLPLILPGIVAGAILCFARAMGEFGATITFVSNIPGRDADAADADLHLHASSRAATPARSG